MARRLRDLRPRLRLMAHHHRGFRLRRPLRFHRGYLQRVHYFRQNGQRFVRASSLPILFARIHWFGS